MLGSVQHDPRWQEAVAAGQMQIKTAPAVKVGQMKKPVTTP